MNSTFDPRENRPTRRPRAYRAAPFAVWLVLALLPAPAGLDPRAWSYAALFAAAWIALMFDAFAPAAVGLVAVAAAAALRSVDPNPDRALGWALTGFSDPAVWTLVGAAMLALGVRASGLATRIANTLLRLAGRRDGARLHYAIVGAELVLAPLVQSPAARTGAILFPLIATLAPPGAEPASRRLAASAAWTAYAASAVTSAITPFAIATATALLIARKSAGIEISSAEYLLGYAPVAIILLLLIPLLAGRAAGPASARETEDVVDAFAPTRWAGRERTMAAILAIVGLLWIAAPLVRDTPAGALALHPATVALVGIGLMLACRIVDPTMLVTDPLGGRTLIIAATLTTLADGLSRVGITRWLTQLATRALEAHPIAPMGALVAFAAVFYWVRYLFAGRTLHVALALPLVLAAATSVPGLPLKPLALLCCWSLGLASVLAPHTNEAGPLIYASGLIDRVRFWRLGFVFGLIYFAALLAVGLPWLTRAP